MFTKTDREGIQLACRKAQTNCIRKSGKPACLAIADAIVPGGISYAVQHIQIPEHIMMRLLAVTPHA